MNNEQMAKFISESRKSLNMTQKELAEKLNITDKAVSKWERGLSYPDISLLTPLAEIFGVTTGELLAGHRNTIPAHCNEEIEKVSEAVNNTLHYVKQASQSQKRQLRSTIMFALSSIFLLAIIVCSICNYAISKALTWSLYPISSVIFVWLILLPLLQSKKKGILTSLSFLSILIIPYLFALDKIMSSPQLFLPIGIRTALISILYLWIIYFLFTALKGKKFHAAAISVLLAVPVSVFINGVVSKYVPSSFFDIWDLITYAILVIAAFILFYIGQFPQKENHLL